MGFMQHTSNSGVGMFWDGFSTYCFIFAILAEPVVLCQVHILFFQFNSQFHISVQLYPDNYGKFWKLFSHLIERHNHFVYAY